MVSNVLSAPSGHPRGDGYGEYDVCDGKYGVCDGDDGDDGEFLILYADDVDVYYALFVV